MPKSKTMDLSPRPISQTRSRSTGPSQQLASIGMSSPKTTTTTTTPAGPAHLVDKRSLDKFLKLASNSASLLDLNQPTATPTPTAATTTSVSNTKLKTSSSNLLSLCGMEKSLSLTSTPPSSTTSNSTTTTTTTTDQVVQQPPAAPTHKPHIVVVEKPLPKPRVVQPAAIPTKPTPPPPSKHIHHHHHHYHHPTTTTTNPQTNTAVVVNNVQQAVATTVGSRQNQKFDSQLDQLLSKQPPIIADAAVISTFRFV